VDHAANWITVYADTDSEDHHRQSGLASTRPRPRRQLRRPRPYRPTRRPPKVRPPQPVL